MIAKTGRYLLANSLYAHLLVVVLVLLPLPFPGTLFAAVLVAFLTLQRGSLDGLASVAWTALPAVAAFWQWQSMAFHYDLSFLICLFTWALAASLRWHKNWVRFFEIILAVGACYILVLAFLPHDVLVQSAAYFENHAMTTLGQFVNADTVAIQKALHDKMFFLLGVLYFALSFICTLYVMLARAWQLAVILPGQRWMEFYSTKMPPYMSVFSLVVVLSAIYWQSDWLEALAFIAVLPFLFGGLSLAIYSCAQGREHRYVRLALFLLAFSILLIVPPLAFALLGLIGFLDSWLNFRKLKGLPVFK